MGGGGDVNGWRWWREWVDASARSRGVDREMVTWIALSGGERGEIRGFPAWRAGVVEPSHATLAALARRGRRGGLETVP